MPLLTSLAVLPRGRHCVGAPGDVHLQRLLCYLNRHRLLLLVLLLLLLLLLALLLLLLLLLRVHRRGLASRGRRGRLRMLVWAAQLLRQRTL